MKANILILIASALLILSACNTSPETAQWRGPERNGFFPEQELLAVWPEEGPELLWTYEGLGKGFAAPAVSSEKIFINAEEEGNAYLLALDLDGKLLWKSPKGKAFLGENFSANYPGARSTPTVYGDRVYTTSGEGYVGCFDTEKGKEIWSLNIIGDLGGILGFFGYSESPAVDEKHVYIVPGGPEHNVVALDRKSGEIAWSSLALRDTFAYGSPVPLDLPQRKVLVTTSRHHITVLDRSKGELLSSYRLKGYEYDGEHCNTPVYQDGYLYFVANDIPGQGSVKLRLADDGTSLEEVWQNPGVMNNFGGFLVIDGSIWTTLKGNKLVILDPESGAISDTIKAASGSLAGSGTKIINYGYNGSLRLLEASKKEPEILSEAKVSGGSGHHFAHPVIAGGVLYIRHGNALMAYRLGS